MTHGRLTGLIVLLTLALRPPTAIACTCTVGPETCPLVADADAVFEATVVSIDTEAVAGPSGHGPFQQSVVRLRDVRAWRGNAQDVVITGTGGGDCGYDFRVGTRYAIVAHRGVEDGRLRTGICSMTQPLAEAAGFREYIQSLSAPSPGGHVWGRVAVSEWLASTTPGRREPSC